jgi:hypothetical protein
MTWTPEEIDAGVTVLIDALKVGVLLDPALAPAEPFIAMFLRYQAHTLKTGLASGAIVPDGHGGLVPITNSRFDPATGEFL